MNGTARRLVRSCTVVGIAATAMLVAGCATPPPPPPAPIAYLPPPKPATTVEEARNFLRTEPSGTAALKEADD